jgi:hypothetical protein
MKSAGSGAGSGSGSLSSLRIQGADPDPSQNVMDPEHCFDYGYLKEFGLFRYPLLKKIRSRNKKILCPLSRCENILSL